MASVALIAAAAASLSSAVPKISQHWSFPLEDGSPGAPAGDESCHEEQPRIEVSIPYRNAVWGEPGTRGAQRAHSQQLACVLNLLLRGV